MTGSQNSESTSATSTAEPEKPGLLLHLAGLGFGVAIAVGVHFVFGLPLSLALLICCVGWPLVGTLITIDDDLPGGWSNPDGSMPPPWREPAFWAHFAGGFAVAAIAAAMEAGWRWSEASGAWLAAIFFASVAAALIYRKWWLLLGAGVSIAAVFL